jgi:uncharacterized protein (TIGR02271 family)
MSAPIHGDDTSEVSMIRSEQQLRVGTEWVDAERVVVRRRIVSHVVQLDVTVRREELVFEQIPLHDPISELPIDPAPPLVVVLHEEAPVVSLTTRPYERVTVSVMQVQDEQVIKTKLDREEILLPGDGPR